MLPSLSLYYFPTDTTCLDMSPEAEVDIRYLLETYREAVGDKFVDHCHVDAQLRELMNNVRQGRIPVEEGHQS